MYAAIPSPLGPCGAEGYGRLEFGQPIGRIRLARERSPPIWLWHVTVTIPGPPFGDATIASESPDRACPETVHRRQHHHQQEGRCRQAR